MGWIWTDDDEAQRQDSHGFHFSSSSSSSSDDGQGATRKVVKSHCRTEEVEPGKFLKKCEKIEEVFKDCAGRPTKLVESFKEYTEEDVTHQMAKGSSGSGSSTQFNFPGLSSDIEVIERNFSQGLDNFIQAAEEITNGFFSMFGPPITRDFREFDSSAETKRPGIPVEGPKELPSELRKSDGDVDLDGLSKDV